MGKPRIFSFLLLLAAGCLFSLGTPIVFAQTQSSGIQFSRNLTLGDSGSDVLSLQTILISEGFLAVAQPTGFFGSLTANAVAAWQASVGLPNTGYFGALSRAKLNSSGAVTSPPPTPINTTPSTPPSSSIPTSASVTFSRNLTLGDSGSDVLSLQTILISEGFLAVAQPTGFFGSLTANAVAAWQASVGLPNTGYFGALSRASMQTQPIATTPTQPITSPIAPITSVTPPPTTTPTPTPTQTNTAGGGGGGSPPTNPTPIPTPLAPPIIPVVPPSAPIITQDTIPPAISITSPQNNATLSSAITFVASANDNIGVAKVEFYLDNALQTSEATAPYSWTWNTTSLNNGLHSILAKAYDAAGNTAVAIVSVTVNNLDITPPTISVTSPVNGATISSSTTITANASDNIGVTSVQFKLDGLNVGAPDTVAPYQIFWNPLTVATGTHTFSAVVTDIAGNTAVAPNITTTVSRPAAPAIDITPPTISITSPIASSTIASSITITISATDNVGVTKIEFYIDGSLRSSTTTAPYNFPLDTTTLTTGGHTLSAKAYDAAGNISTSVNIPVIVARALPSVPVNVSATATTATTIALAWSASNEPGGAITGYKIFRGGVQVATAVTNTFTDTGLTASTTYSYTISSYDAKGNNSALSSGVNASTQAAPVNPPDYNLGFSVGESLMGLSNASLTTALNDITALGAGWLRIDVQWDHVQPTSSSSYNWGYLDAFVSAAATRHIKLLAIIDYTPTWAESSACIASIVSNRCPPANVSQYVTFAQAAVTRYASQVSAWEIWNEPNLAGGWEPAADVTAYAALLKSAYAGIKAVSPSAFVISGGLGPATSTGGNISPISFLTQLYAAGAGSSFDAVGFHPYTFPTMPLNYYPWNAWSQMSLTTPSLRSIMTANGDAGKQIWMTEYGAPTGGPGLLETSATDTQFLGSPDKVTEPLQAQMISQAITTAGGYSWAGPLFIYGYKDQGTSQSTVENFFGVVRYDGSDKPSYTTIQSLL